MTPHPLRVHAALLGVSVIYGFFYIAVKLLLMEISQADLIFMRFGLSALIVGLVEFIYFKTVLGGWENILKVASVGLLGVFLVQILLVIGINHTTAFHAALIMSMIPIFTLCFSLLLKREVFQWPKLMGILLAFSGVAVLLLAKNPSVPLPPHYVVGDTLVSITAVSFAAFLLGSQSLLKQYNSYSLMSYCYMFSALAFVTVLLLKAWVTGDGSELALHFVHRLSMQGWLLILYTVLFASILTYTLNNYGLRHASPTSVAMYVLLQPVISACFGFYILHEPFTLTMGMAALLTFCGIIIAARSATLAKEQLTPQQETESVEPS